ncbi:hypothetical protein ABW19_dt0206661 [Dactylella cylindrospora]|nr:hypothetical protein ABW19_dt0206661 [Dactylella cylindrospora]
MVTLEQTSRGEAGDPFQGPVAPHHTGPAALHPSSQYQSASYPQLPMPQPPSGPYNMSPMQDALPDHNPYRQLQKQRTGQSEGSYPGQPSYLSTSYTHQRTGSQDRPFSELYPPLQPTITPQPSNNYTPSPPSSYRPPAARNQSVSSISSNSNSPQPLATTPGTIFPMENEGPPTADPFAVGATATAPTKSADWWDSPVSSQGDSPTSARKQMSLEEQLENEFHRGRGAIAPAPQQLPQQPIQQPMPQPISQPMQLSMPQPVMQPAQQPAPQPYQSPMQHQPVPQPYQPPGQQQQQQPVQQSFQQSSSQIYSSPVAPPLSQQNVSDPFYQNIPPVPPHPLQQQAPQSYANVNEDPFGPIPSSNEPAVPPKVPENKPPANLADIHDIQSGRDKEVDNTSQLPIPVSSDPTARPPEQPAISRSIPLETYQIKHVRFLNTETNKLSQASILIQNENGPCPLIALVNVLSLSRETLVLGEGLRIRETLSLELLLNVVCEELVLTGSWAGDLSELFNFLMGLRTGMNVNPKFIGDEITADDFLRSANIGENRPLPQPRPGDFERTRELDLYSAFAIPLVHGWLPAPTSPMFPVLVKHARDFEKAQDLILQQQFILERSSKGEPISAEDSEIAAKGHEIQEFLNSASTQITSYGLNVLQRKLQPGSWSIFFRNDHFSVLYKHARNGELYTLVTDGGYASYEEIVWESLVDASGRGGAYFSGDFRPVGHGHDGGVSQRQSDGILDPNRGDNGWQLVQNRRSSRNQTGTATPPSQRRPVQSLIPPDTASPRPVIPPDAAGDTTDYDLALAIHLQQEEEERANRIAQNRANLSPSRITNLSSANQPPVRSLIPAHPVGARARPQSTGQRPPQPPRPTGRHAEELRNAANRANNDEEIPPPYAPSDPNPTAFLPPVEPPGPGHLGRHASFPTHSSPTQSMGSFSRPEQATAYGQMNAVYNQSGSHYPGSARGRRASHMGGHPQAVGEDDKKCSIM